MPPSASSHRPHPRYNGAVPQPVIPILTFSALPMNEAAIQALRTALEVSPDNVPLRQHLADTLLGLSRSAEAEQEYRKALAQAPDNDDLKLGLARAFLQQGKNGEALVIVEALLARPNTPAAGLRPSCPLAPAGRRGGAGRPAVSRGDRSGCHGRGDPELAAQLGDRRRGHARARFRKAGSRSAWEQPAGAGRGRGRTPRGQPSRTSAAWMRSRTRSA